jgi:hypothetical protein
MYSEVTAHARVNNCGHNNDGVETACGDSVTVWRQRVETAWRCGDNVWRQRVETACGDIQNIATVNLTKYCDCKP